MKLPSPLFDGKGQPLGGLSNELALVHAGLPEVERQWTDAADEIFFSGSDTKEWKWKEGLSTQSKQKALSVLNGALGSFDTKHQDKKRLVGWMLSEVLDEPPKGKPDADDT